MADPEKEPIEPKEGEDEKEIKPEGEEEKPEGGEKKPIAPAPEEEEPPVRKSAKDFIIERQQKKIKKLAGKQDDEEEEEEDEEVTPEGRKAIDKAIEQRIAPILQGQRSNADEAELSQVFAEYPGSKELEKDIRKYMEHPAYKDVSVEFIYLGLAAKKGKFQQMKDVADKKAKASGMGGSGQRKAELPEIPDVSKYTDAQMEALALKVKTQR